MQFAYKLLFATYIKDNSTVYCTYMTIIINIPIAVKNPVNSNMNCIKSKSQQKIKGK